MPFILNFLKLSRLLKFDAKPQNMTPPRLYPSHPHQDEVEKLLS